MHLMKSTYFKEQWAQMVSTGHSQVDSTKRPAIWSVITIDVQEEFVNLYKMYTVCH